MKGDDKAMYTVAGIVIIMLILAAFMYIAWTASQSSSDITGPGFMGNLFNQLNGGGPQ